MRAILRAAAVFALAGAATAASAQVWPTKPVRLVVPMPAGGGSDLVARAMAQRLGETWGQPVIIDNRAGGGGIIAVEGVARAPGDGHTILFAIDSGITTAPHLQKVPYDPVRDFAPVTHITSFSTVLVGHPTVPAANFQELAALAKAHPEKLSYASSGLGSGSHLLTVLLADRAGLRLLHVPYKGIPQLSLAVVTGEVNLAWAGVFSFTPHVKSGKVRAYAYGGKTRTRFLPDVPTVIELGYPDVEHSVWYGVLAPAATPRPVVTRMHADISKLLADAAFAEKELVGRGYEPTGFGLEEFGAFIRREIEARAAMVKLAGVKPE